jgi:internalin A
MRIDTFVGQEKRLLFWENGDDSIRVKKYMNEHGLTGIVFSKYRDFQGDKVEIHEPYEFVDEIDIIDSNIIDISFISNFPNVKKLNIQNDDRTKLDLSCFHELEDLFLIWRKGVTNLFNRKSLKKIRMEGFKEKVLPKFENDMPLEEFWLSISPVEDLSSLGSLKNLKNLYLDYLRCLEDSAWIRELKTLEIFMISSCKKMSNGLIDNLSGLPNLKKLYLSKMGEIPTLQPIQNLNAIETIGITEETKIMDGNLQPLLELPNLKSINIQGFKHYNPSVGSIRNAIGKGNK